MSAPRAGRLRRLAGAWRVAPRVPPAGVRVGTDALPAAGSERLRAAVAAALDRERVPGAQVAVRRRGSLLWSACAGRVDRAGEPVTEADRFVLASATKPVTATLVCLLAERRELDLDAPVSTWLPELPHAGRLTVRELLRHRSGLAEYTRDKAVAARMNGGEPEYAWRRGEVLAAIARLGPRGRPGGRFRYRNSNYVVAAEIAERASGRDLEALLAELVARPLGLHGVSFAREVEGTRLATPHVALLGRAFDVLDTTGGHVPTDAIGPVWGDGGIAASAGDLARFLEALLAGELTAPATRRAMVPPVRRRGGAAYGLGILARRSAGAVVAGHDGMYSGWTASVSTDDATGTTVAVACNLAGPRIPAVRVAAAARAALA